ncbi:MAG TPA: hypothetical protein VLF20_03425 [Patescibacteria group bacterium]|nr:hypothetical protein [Patescibacteria group bacterium]
MLKDADRRGALRALGVHSDTNPRIAHRTVRREAFSIFRQDRPPIQRALGIGLVKDRCDAYDTASFMLRPTTDGSITHPQRLSPRSRQAIGFATVAVLTLGIIAAEAAIFYTMSNSSTIETAVQGLTFNH